MGEIFNKISEMNDVELCCGGVVVLIVFVLILWGFVVDPLDTGIILLILFIIGIIIYLLHKRDEIFHQAQTAMKEAGQVIEELNGKIRNVRYVNDPEIYEKIVEEYANKPNVVRKIKELYRELYEAYRSKKHKRVILLSQEIKKLFEPLEKETKKKFHLVYYKGYWIPLKKAMKFKEIELGLANNFENVDPFEFERFVSNLLKKMGYNTEVTPKTGDYGVDIKAEKDGMKIVVQVKRWKNPVPPAEINKLLGAMRNFRADRAIFVTTSRFTKNARRIAERNPEIELWDMEKLRWLVRKYMIEDEFDTM